MRSVINNFRATYMKSILIFLSSIILAFNACNTPVQSGVKSNEQKTDSIPAKVEYTCPMHPEIVRDQPGACPKCGMDLVKKW